MAIVKALGLHSCPLTSSECCPNALWPLARTSWFPELKTRQSYVRTLESSYRGN